LKRAVFLDRDGVINKTIIRNGKPYSPSDMSQVEIIAGVNSALDKFRYLNFEIIVVTNQPNIARGIDHPNFLIEVHNYLKSKLSIENFYICLHDDSDNCICRKPLPGLLMIASQELDINLSDSYMIGDRWKDIEAGQQAGCMCFFINYGYDEKQPEKPYTEVNSLLEAATVIERRL
jgi:D-glycero-D-manno-heptose 1,7-bisphosphate phosphatase